ncbi:hypothetical protein D3C86_1165840 [compost metagenome]
MAARFWATCKSKVDLPMPGSPPSSTSEPGTTPPPSTRSSSSRPLLKRSSSWMETSRRRWGARPMAGDLKVPGLAAPVGAGAEMASSTREFQALHSGHLPIQRGCSEAHCWQTYLVLTLAMGASSSLE